MVQVLASRTARAKRTQRYTDVFSHNKTLGEAGATHHDECFSTPHSAALVIALTKFEWRLLIPLQGKIRDAAFFRTRSQRVTG